MAGRDGPRLAEFAALRRVAVKIVAYADRISVAPGDRLSVKASCSGLTSYRAELRRIIQGDINPEGPGYSDELIAADLGGPFPARHQPIYRGSYAAIDALGPLAGLQSYSIAALIWPTLPETGAQAIVSQWNETAGFEMFLDASAGACFRIWTAEGAAVATTGVPCLAKQWYVIAATFEASSGILTIEQRSVRPWPGIRDCGEGRAELRFSIPRYTDGRLLIAAGVAPHGRTARHFNGKIEAPRIYSGVRSTKSIENELLHTASSLGGALAAWDFSLGMHGNHISDIGLHALHGRVFNLPHRAVTGIHWDGSVHRASERPSHYGAIHFHDDDLSDANWNTDFEVTIPASLRSGVYAIRLHSDDDPSSEFYVVFAVRPAPSATRSSVVFVLPTASYMAYANHRLGLDVPETEIGMGQLVQLDRHHVYLQEHPELGLSLYETHSDGSGVFYSTRLRPILDMQPKVQGFLGCVGSNVWQFNADTHILGWLDQVGVPFDVLTDEDLDAEGEDALLGYRVAITGSHPEYASARMLAAYASHLARSGRLMYLGGNGFYWRVSFDPENPGVLECRRSESGIRPWDPGTGNYWHGTTDELGGLWRRLGRTPNSLVGVGMAAQGFDVSSPYVRTVASRDARVGFIFDGVTSDTLGSFGLTGGAAAGSEIDRTDVALGTPPHALTIASSVRHTDVYLLPPEELLDPIPSGTGTQTDQIRADMVFFETPAGGAVFSVGSIAYAGALAWNRFDNDVARISRNVLTRFLDDSPFVVEPAS
jgi:N,N-dimethylformamidase